MFRGYQALKKEMAEDEINGNYDLIIVRENCGKDLFQIFDSLAEDGHFSGQEWEKRNYALIAITETV